MISDTPWIANSKLLANWLLVPSKQLLRLITPDYAPPFIGIIRGMNWDCSHPAIPVLPDAPLICKTCLKQIGTISGLAAQVNTIHKDCKQSAVFDAPWTGTVGFNLIAHAAFKKHRAYEPALLLTHYLITEFIAGNHLARFTEQREQKLNELSRYYVASGTGAEFNYCASLST